ncbi:MAG: hypothetical protein ABIJ09_17590 [Pseudomonadota bacterium]
MNLDPHGTAILTFVAHHRCATSGQIRFGAGLPWGSELTFKQTLGELRSAGLLGLYRIPASGQRVYHLTRKGLQQVTALGEPSDLFQKHPDENWAIHGWLRSQLHCVLTLQGWNVGRGAAAVEALRSRLLLGSRHSKDLARLVRLSPLLEVPEVHRCDCGSTVADGISQARCLGCCTSVPYPATSIHRCRHCGFTSVEPVEFHDRPDTAQRCLRIARPDHLLPFDVAFRHLDGEPLVMLLLVDNIQRSVTSQLGELPLRYSVYDAGLHRNVHPEKLPLMVVPANDGSVFDPVRDSWSNRGPRLRAFQQHFDPQRPAIDFPFSRTATLVQPPASVCWEVLRVPGSINGAAGSGQWQEEVCCDIKVA